MAEVNVCPYRFPTTVCLIDDNADFLTNFSLQLDPELAYRLFESPAAALRHLNRAARHVPLYQRCFSEHREVVGWSLSDHVIRLDVSSLEKEMGNPERFSEVSVVVVDYDMPGLDGLEFCKRIENPQIKRILLTGVGDEKVAVRAFNEGVIDRFILKSERNVAEEVNCAIGELQEAYFRDASALIRRSLNLDSGSFLADPIFADYLRELVQTRSFVEYYYTAEPDGLLLADAAGAISRLLVYTESDMRAQWEIAVDQHCPQGLADALEERKVVPYFWDTGGYYRPERQAWQEYVYPAEVVVGRESYFVALLENPPPYRHASRAITSYHAYLDRLDDRVS